MCINHMAKKEAMANRNSDETRPGNNGYHVVKLYIHVLPATDVVSAIQVYNNPATI